MPQQYGRGKGREVGGRNGRPAHTALVGHADSEYTFETKKAPAKARAAAKVAS